MCEQENSRREICGRVKRSEPEYQSSDVTTSEAEGTTAAKTANFKRANFRTNKVRLAKAEVRTAEGETNDRLERKKIQDANFPQGGVEH